MKIQSAAKYPARRMVPVIAGLLGALWWVQTQDHAALSHGPGGAKNLLPIATNDPLAAEFAGAYPASASPVGVVRDFTVTAAPASIELLQGKQMPVWAYNGEVPGPTMRIRLGETLRVRFLNRLEQSSTIHWHGIRLPNAMDGVPGVTQDPVEPGGTFVYEFTPKDAGTFWFHPHIRSSEQVERGLFGVLIVEEPEPTPFTRELVWVFDDWLLNEDGSLFESFVTRHDLAHDGRWGNLMTVNGTRTPTFQVRPGERVRIRIVNVANGRVFNPQIAGLSPDVIAVDGMSLPAPRKLDRFDLAPGNRLDLDLVVPSDFGGQTFQVVDGFSPNQPVLAYVEVSGEQVTPRGGKIPRGTVPTWSTALQSEPTLTLHLNARMGGPYGVEWTINDRSMRHGETRGGEDHGAGHHAPYFLPTGHFARIRFVNDSSRLHPMHIHGQFFKVLARDGVAVNEPQWRDTVLLRGRQTMDVGLVPLDEGDWMLHCHILEHADSGMMTLVRVGAE